MRALSNLTQAQVAARMGTTQTAIARLERGEQSPSTTTLKAYARATGFCLEIGFVRSGEQETETGSIIIVDNAGGVSNETSSNHSIQD